MQLNVEFTVCIWKIYKNNILNQKNHMEYMKFYGIMSLNEAKRSLMTWRVSLWHNVINEAKCSLMTCTLVCFIIV